jgi:Rrf2 family protein
MQVSAKTDYGLCAVLLLAARQPEFLNIAALLNEHAMPRKFLSAILVDLRDAGIVNTRRGPNGGYALAGPASELTLGTVFRAINGPFRTYQHGTGVQAGLQSSARLTKAWSVVAEIMESALDEVTVAQVLAESAPGRGRAADH